MAFFDLNEIVQHRIAADPTGKPAPFAIGDFQAVVLTGAIGAAGDMDQLAGLIGLQIAQKVNLPGGLNGRVQRQEVGRSGSGGQDFGRQHSVNGETKDQKNGKKERPPPQVRDFEPPASVESFSQLL